MFPLIFALLAITAYIPVSTRPEQAYQRLSDASSAVASICCPPCVGTQPDRRALDRWRRAFHVREVVTLPAKLGAWAKAIDTKALPGTTPQQVQTLTNRLQALTYRMQELLGARQSPQADLLVRELLEDCAPGDWRFKGSFKGWAGGRTPIPAPVPSPVPPPGCASA